MLKHVSLYPTLGIGSTFVALFKAHYQAAEHVNYVALERFEIDHAYMFSNTEIVPIQLENVFVTKNTTGQHWSFTSIVLLPHLADRWSVPVCMNQKGTRTSSDRLSAAPDQDSSHFFVHREGLNGYRQSSRRRSRIHRSTQTNLHLGGHILGQYSRFAFYYAAIRTI